MKKLQATNDKTKFAIVDDDVFETIQQMGLKFCINSKGYFSSTKWIQLPCMTEKKWLYLHHFVYILKTGEKPAISVDHIDRNKSNNQFENLRLATSQQQQHNQGKHKNNTSGLIGVYHKHNVDKRNNKKYEFDYWCTKIHKPGGKHEAKTFPYTEAGKIAAGKWYDKKAREYFAEFHGQLNFPDDNKTE